MKALGLYGAPFAGIFSFQQGLRDILPDTQIIHVGSGPLVSYLPLAEAWIYLHEEGREHIPELLASGKAAVCRSLPLIQLGLPAVHIDDELAARRLAEHQIQQGARSLHYWGLPATFSHRRSRGVRAAAQAASLPFFEHPDLESTVTALSASGQDRIGFIGMNDQWCHQVAAALHTKNIAIPQKVLLAGFDNITPPDAPWSIPLTTVILPIREQGQLAAQLLSADQPIPVKVHLTTPPTMIVRSSTSPDQ